MRRLALARRQAPFLDHVGELTVAPSAISMVLLKRDEYRKALDGYITFRRNAAARLEEPLLESPLENLPQLYETWGVLAVMDETLRLASQLGYESRQQRIVGRDVSGIFARVLQDGQPAIVMERVTDGVVVRVTPQRSYARRGRPYRSISYTQRPDVVVEIERPGREAEIYIFDPKYKLASEAGPTTGSEGRPKKLDIDTMHAYRDAIRDQDGSRIVRSAVILYPGPDREFGRGLGAISAVPGINGALRHQLEVILHPALR